MIDLRQLFRVQVIVDNGLDEMSGVSPASSHLHPMRDLQQPNHRLGTLFGLFVVCFANLSFPALEDKFSKRVTLRIWRALDTADVLLVAPIGKEPEEDSIGEAQHTPYVVCWEHCKEFLLSGWRAVVRVSMAFQKQRSSAIPGVSSCLAGLDCYAGNTMQTHFWAATSNCFFDHEAISPISFRKPLRDAARRLIRGLSSGVRLRPDKSAGDEGIDGLVFSVPEGETDPRRRLNCRPNPMGNSSEELAENRRLFCVRA